MQFRRPILPRRLGQQQRGIAAPDLNDSSWLVVTNHAIGNQRIESFEAPVLKIERNALRRSFQGNLVVFRAKSGKRVAEKLPLPRLIHLNARHRRRSFPNFFLQTPGIGNRLVEMNRCHMKPVRFPRSKPLGKILVVKTTRHDFADKTSQLIEVGWIRGSTLEPFPQ